MLFCVRSHLLITRAHPVMTTKLNHLEIKIHHTQRSRLQRLLLPMRKRLVLLMHPKRKIRRKIKEIKLVCFFGEYSVICVSVIREDSEDI